MASKFCMNEHCRTTTSSEWKKGWGLKSGGFATLCYTCGSAFEKIAYCETFHLNESGWRECRMCRKPIHCGCIASQYLFEYMDFGGIGCLSCTRCLGGHTLMPIQIPNEDAPSGILGVTNSADTQHILFENKMDQNIFDKRRLLQFGNGADASEPVHLFQFQNHDKIRQEESIIPAMEVRLCIPNHNQQSPKSSFVENPENCISNRTVKETAKCFNQPSLNFFMSTPMGTSSSTLPVSSGVSPFQLEQKPHHILAKPPKASSNSGFESKSGISTPRRSTRPLTEGRGSRNQMLPRYWPRITDQELQRLSGDLKSTIVPLFEKVLSASDAGRIGRLVIPKACAEAYFPYIEQSEGMPITMQDVKGKEWTFQFRFWPNNNSRMYVLEGVTPCIQNMQLEAGDTVTFSRIDPGGKLFMGFRKAVIINAVAPVGLQTSLLDSKNPAISNSTCSTETPLSGATDNQAMPKHEKDGGNETDNFLQRNGIVPEKKKIRNIGCKNKRLLIHTEDAMELKITWEEAQDLLCPPPNVNPTIIMIEDCEFEEYDEPPVFGKRTVFTTPSSGEQGQWAQCDNCSKWRRLPVHDLLPSNWTCSDNIWDSNRCSCSSSSEMNQKELDPFLRDSNKETKRQSNGCGEPSGLDALASIASLRDSSSNGNNLGGTEEPPCTTKHPRHRPGCTCIVCIQPPSGKGKHDPSCKCNVCLTVRRRFKTLMQRKKKKPTERGAETAQVKDGTLGRVSVDEPCLVGQMNCPENGDAPYPNWDRSTTSKGQLDLNCHPNENKAGS
ncbi:unnamed protein product [Cuscuta campestris]|uniref:TF-B3 domain-containing protein n=1 Tax=Cuscuta campestris TaxID=132261 RepID=A0A484LV76_9ASTE|nr:unnamed protein product [Cuscuta campestris]